MNAHKSKIDGISTLMLLVLTLFGAFVPSQSHAAEIDPFDIFLTELKTNSVDHFSMRQDDLELLRDCLKVGSNCEQLELQTGFGDVIVHNQGLSQERVWEMLQDRWREYRRNVALRGAVVFDMYINRPVYFFKATEVSATMTFDRRSADGQEELETIIHEAKRDNGSLVKAQAIFPGKMATNLRTRLYDETIKSMSVAYPYFLLLSQRELELSDLLEALETMIEACASARLNALSYEGDERAKLLGLPSVVEATMTQFTDAELNEIDEHLIEAEKQLGLKRKLKEFVTNWKMMSVLGCYGATMLVRPLAWLQFVCGLAGMGVAGHYLYYAAIEMGESSKFWKTGLYTDEALLTDKAYLMVMVVMTGVYVKTSTGSLVRRGRNFFNKSRELIARRAQATEAGHLLWNPAFMTELRGQVVKQLTYNSQKKGLEVGADLTAAKQEWAQILNQLVKSNASRFSWQMAGRSITYSQFIELIYDKSVTI